jgi:AcrR family transcriptional regulator
MSSSTGATPQRRRGAALEDALLDAAWDELNAVGYYDFTFDGVAARAGTSKTVLYRRWANRLELVRAALRAHRRLISGPQPDTGSLRGDVIAQLERISLGLHDLRPDIAWGMLSEAISSNAQSGFLQNQIHQTNVEAMERVLKQAEARGEVRMEDIPARVMTLPFDLARHELMITGRPVTKEAIIQIVDDVFLPLVMRTGKR